jgi:hypothetical protein
MPRCDTPGTGALTRTTAAIGYIGPTQYTHARRLPVDVIVTVPDGTSLDGAIVELYRETDGHIAAEVRIPAPTDQP